MNATEFTEAKAKQLRAKFANDPHRPRYHFQAPANWMNDPNGLIQWQEQYHLFYQHNPHQPTFGNSHWGHAVSNDLVHWQDLPIALSPTPDGADRDGVWSGCAFDNNGVPTIIYTGAIGLYGDKQRPCLAVSRDNLLSFEKHPGNPIIDGPPPDLNVIGFRDHAVWEEAGIWYQIVGSGIEGVGGAALLYRSADLINWEYLHPLWVGDKTSREPIWTGEMWECVDFFPLGDKHVLIFSVFARDKVVFYYPVYAIGEYSNLRFSPQKLGFLDLGGQLSPDYVKLENNTGQGQAYRIDLEGGHLYAPQTFRDKTNRRILIGWVQEGRSRQAQKEAGWSGMFSLPRELTLRPDGTLGIEPITELQQLRTKKYQWKNLEIEPNGNNYLPDVKGAALEIEIEVEWKQLTASEWGLILRQSPDGSEETRISYDAQLNKLIFDPTRSSLEADLYPDIRSGNFVLEPDEAVKLRIFLDHSIVEVYANGRACLTGRIYPSRSDSLQLDLFSTGGSMLYKTVTVYELASIWLL
jgi:beta-fructofuranosidase